VQGGWRIAAPAIDRAVLAAAKGFLEDRPALLAAPQESGILISEIRRVLELAADCSRRLLSENEGATALSKLIEKVRLTSGGIRVSFSVPLPARAEETNAQILTSLVRYKSELKRWGANCR
jgi:hypothetical protein